MYYMRSTQVQSKSKVSPRNLSQKKDTAKCLILISNWWVMTGSNRRPSACKADALPTELITQRTKCYLFSILSQVQGWLKKINGGTDGTRTRDPRRDRPVF